MMSVLCILYFQCKDYLKITRLSSYYYLNDFDLYAGLFYLVLYLRVHSYQVGILSEGLVQSMDE